MTSNVIVFVSLFLGLVTGRQTIEVAVSEEVARVEIVVDGSRVGELNGSPWSLEVDLAPELTTQELTAIAFDGAGKEIGRTIQLLNVPRAGVEAEVLLEEWQDGIPTVARVLWQSAEGLKPDRTVVSLDGSPVRTGPSAADSLRIELPKLRPDAVHFISAELVFPDDLVATAEAVFGGAHGSSVETEITAVPLVVRQRRARTIEGASGWLRHANGAGLPVVAIDQGPAEVAVVRDEEAIVPLAVFDVRMRRVNLTSYRRMNLTPKDRLRFVSTRPSKPPTDNQDHGYKLFQISQAYGPKDGSLPRLLAAVKFPARKRSQRLTDALAIAGRQVVESQKRRAVLLVTTDCASVQGDHSAKTVRRYLEELHVPLKVWQLGEVPANQRASGLCQTAEEITTIRKYEAAVHRLRADLENQQIVWVRGRPLPRDITLTPKASGVRLAGQK